MSENTVHFGLTLSCIIALIVALITFAVAGDTAHAGESLAALAGFVGGNAIRAPRALTAAATIGAAGIVATMMGGCSGPLTATAVIKPSCAAVELLHHTCQLIDPQTFGDSQP